LLGLSAVAEVRQICRNVVGEDERGFASLGEPDFAAPDGCIECRPANVQKFKDFIDPINRLSQAESARVGSRSFPRWRSRLDGRSARIIRPALVRPEAKIDLSAAGSFPFLIFVGMHDRLLEFRRSS
jgi:hypothetical protein